MPRKKFNIDINISDEIDVKYGLLQPDNKKVIYITGKGWALPHNTDNCEQKAERIQRKFERYITNKLAKNSQFVSRKILDFYFPTNAFIAGKKKFFQFDCVIRQRGDYTLDAISPSVIEFSRDISLFLTKTFEENSFSLTKVK